MATFQIHEDSEKENSRYLMAEKVVSTLKVNVLQPIGAMSHFKQISTTSATAMRANYTAVNGNVINNNKNTTMLAVKKPSFRDVANVKINENTSYNIAGGGGGSNGIYNGNVPPIIPVDQFKSFSVYEDSNVEKKDDNTNDNSPVFNDEICVSKGNSFQEHRLSFHSVCNASIGPNISNGIGQYGRSILRNDRQRFFDVVEYQNNILEYFYESEKKHRPKANYMRRQTDINYSMRTILVDWLVEVSEEYNLDTETLYLSVWYIDRFLSHMAVVRSKLQLVGTAAMYIASKYEEVYPPDVSEFVFITDDTYNKAQVLRMEQIILKILRFDLCTATPNVFINMYTVINPICNQVKFLTHYICELSLLEADPYLRFNPSLISSASLALARQILNYPIWTKELQEITTYSLDDLKEIMLYLCQSHNMAVSLPQQAIQDKYKSAKYYSVSSIAPIEMNEEIFHELLRKNAEQITAEEYKTSTSDKCKSSGKDAHTNIISLGSGKNPNSNTIDIESQLTLNPRIGSDNMQRISPMKLN